MIGTYRSGTAADPAFSGYRARIGWRQRYSALLHQYLYRGEHRAGRFSWLVCDVVADLKAKSGAWRLTDDGKFFIVTGGVQIAGDPSKAQLIMLAPSSGPSNFPALVPNVPALPDSIARLEKSINESILS